MVFVQTILEDFFECQCSFWMKKAPHCDTTKFSREDDACATHQKRCHLSLFGTLNLFALDPNLSHKVDFV